jgi:hypothetical protein
VNKYFFFQTQTNTKTVTKERKEILLSMQKKKTIAREQKKIKQKHADQSKEHHRK